MLNKTIEMLLSCCMEKQLLQVIKQEIQLYKSCYRYFPHIFIYKREQTYLPFKMYSAFKFMTLSEEKIPF